MNYQLQYLAHLVLLKNEVNRRRRRFYHLYNRPYTQREKPAHKMFPEQFAKDMYAKACREMRSMTPLMREVAKAAGASLVWGDSWQVRAIRYGDRYIKDSELIRLAELYKADEILLGE